MPRLRTFFVALVGVLLGSFLVTGCGSDDGPQAKADKDPTAGFVLVRGDGFTVRFPTKADKHEQTVSTVTGKVKAVFYSTEPDPAGTYIAALTAYAAGTVLNLDKAVVGGAKNVSGTVLEKTTGTYRGHKTRDVRISCKIAGAKATMFARFIDVDGKLFQVQYVEQGTRPADPPAEYDTVANSVRFTG